MITISLCMIVKNEETLLSRCLDSVAALMDEIIIVDTGSTDRTKEIARHYTDKIYDFEWCGDFSAARNFSFSKASMEYIYAPDADEYLDPENQEQFRRLKQVLLPEIEIVQMYYQTPKEYNTVQNVQKELRPKLFKRLRTFTWIDPVHETVRLTPVVFDSDIVIRHLPESAHEKRDFAVFCSAWKRDGYLSERIITMYAKELLKCGTREDFATAADCFEQLHVREITAESTCVLAHHYRISEDFDHFFSIALKNIAEGACSEICCELGDYYRGKGDIDEAILWYTNAAFETSPVLTVESGGRIPLSALSSCYYMKLSAASELTERDKIEEYRGLAEKYHHMSEEWELPQQL